MFSLSKWYLDCVTDAGDAFIGYSARLRLGVLSNPYAAFTFEPQTPIVFGLRIYQWMAILSFAAGIVLTTLPDSADVSAQMVADPRVLVAAVLYGLLTGFAMGVDFPGSARRFARLASP